MGVNKNYVNESDVTESVSCHAEVKVNGVDKLDDTESGSVLIKVEVNGVKSNVIDSESVRNKVQKKSVTKCRDGGKAAVKLCKKTFVISGADSAQTEVQSEVIAPGCNSMSQCVDHVNSSVSGGEKTSSDQMEVRRGSIEQTIDVSRSEKLTKSESASTDDHLMPTSCDVHSAINANTQSALSPFSTVTKFQEDVSVRTAKKASEVDGKIIELREISDRLVSRDLPTVHKEGIDSQRQQFRTNCRLITTKITPENLPTVRSDGSETDRQRLRDNCEKLTVYNSSEIEHHANSRPASVNLTKTHSRGVEIDHSTSCQLSVAYCDGAEIGRCQQIDCRLPKVVHQGSINCQSPVVHKCRMLVDCDVNVPHNVWTTLVNHNSLASDDTLNTSSHCASLSMSNIRTSEVYDILLP